MSVHERAHACAHAFVVCVCMREGGWGSEREEREKIV